MYGYYNNDKKKWEPHQMGFMLLKNLQTDEDVVLNKKGSDDNVYYEPALSRVGKVFKDIYETRVKKALDNFTKKYSSASYKRIAKDVDFSEENFSEVYSSGLDLTPNNQGVRVSPEENLKSFKDNPYYAIDGYYLNLSKLKDRENIKFVEPMKYGGEVKNFSKGTEVSSQDGRLYYNFRDRLGASAEGAKDVLASEALKLTQPEESAKGVSKAQIFDRLGAIPDLGYLGYDVLRHLGGKKDAFSADPEKRPLSSDWMAKWAGMPYSEKELAGRILGGLTSFNLTPAIRGSLGMVKNIKHPGQGELDFGTAKNKPTEQGIGSFQDREEFTDFSTQPSRLGNQSLFPKERKQGRKLLVLGCCKSKAPQEFDIPARERYIGQLFQVLNKYDLEKGLPDNVDIAVLSAKHGLIRLDTPLQDYNLPMEPKHRDALLGNEDQVGRINNTFEGYDDVFVAAGKDYTKVIDNVTGRESYKTYKDIDKKVEGIGDHKRILGNWLTAEKGRSEGVGTLKDTPKKMFTKKDPTSFEESIELIRETNESLPKVPFSKRYAKKTEDLRQEAVSMNPYDPYKFGELEQEVKLRKGIEALIFEETPGGKSVMDEATREAVVVAVDPVIGSRRKGGSFNQQGTTKYFKPVINDDNVRGSFIFTPGKNPKLRVLFQELPQPGESAKPPKFIDYDEMKYDDYTPDAFTRRAQGGGINSLNTVARAMNYR